MTDRDPKDPKKSSRKPSALDQLERLRAGLREGASGGPERLSSGDAIRRARDPFGADDGGRVSSPRFRVNDESAEDERARLAASRDATRLGDADAGEDGSLVRAMLRDIKPGDAAARSASRAARAEQRRRFDDAYEDDGYPEDDIGDADAYEDDRDDPSGYGDRARGTDRYGAAPRYAEDDRYDDIHPDDDPYAEPLDEAHDPYPSRGARPPRPPRDFGGGRGPSSAARAPSAPPSGRGPAPFGALERMLAGRYLRARRQEGFISVIAMLSLIGVTLGVAVLIVVMSVMNGFRAELVGKIVGLDGHMSIRAVETDANGTPLRYVEIPDYQQLSSEIRGVGGVIMAAPVIESPVFATGLVGDGTGAAVRGMTREDFLQIDPVAANPEQSRGLAVDFGSNRSVAIGWQLARELGLRVGDDITILAPTSVSTPFGRSPRRRVFEVVYIFQAGYFEHDRALIYMPIEDAQDLFGFEATAERIDLAVATPENLSGYRIDLQEILGANFLVQDWTETRGGLVSALQTEQTVMFFILSMLILIASLVIISGLIMLVKEKGPGIAILRTMGLSRGGVMRVFFMCGAFIGVLGTILGVALGVVVALNLSEIKGFIESSFGVELFPNNVYFLSELPSRLDWGDVTFTIMLTLGISFLATLYPARKAARLDPVEGLRNG